MPTRYFFLVSLSLGLLVTAPTPAPAQAINGVKWARYQGGSGDEPIRRIEIASSGEIVVCGHTNSSDFPTTVGSIPPTGNTPPANAFVTVLSPDGTIRFSMVFGGSQGGTQGALGAKLDSAAGLLYVSGFTDSADFPTTPNTAVQPSFGGTQDGFLSIIDVTSGQFVYSTFLGGPDGETFWDLAVAPSGSVWVTGFSSSSDFRTTPGAYDRTHNGSGDMVIANIDPGVAGPAGLLYSTFIGGSDGDSASNVKLDSRGVLTIAGTTSSVNFPRSTHRARRSGT